MADFALTLSPATNPFPFTPLVLASYVGATTTFDLDVSQPTLTTQGKQITDSDEIVSVLGLGVSGAGESTKLATFVALSKTIQHLAAYPEVVTALDSLDDHLAYRTFLVAHTVSAADIAVWGSLRGNLQAQGVLKRNQHTHLNRWYSYIEALPAVQAATTSLVEAKANKAKNTKTAASFALGLQGAVQGQVVTRFPPEPSGYLHIGHTKAAILNQYFAKMYDGKLIVRFDDTNPSKERTEYEDTILEDLHLLDIKGDVVTHTSDYFAQLHDYAVEMIKRGKAYADDTIQAQMQKERWDGIASQRRECTVAENLQRFADMASGSDAGTGWCLRAKISADDPNKALRDPVIYRVNHLPHHRTGDKWKAYPTYDFACPIVDALEGVTHALRTNEYRDRNPQYQWMLDALGLRKVNVWDFSRVNFIYTLLSKRKLLWFVEQGLVKGWDDPRFPTVRGIRRRGMTIEALKQYMLAQGPSQAQIMLEWDGIWSTNKKVIDPIAPRFWAVAKEKTVKVTINGQSGVETKSLPRHKKNADVGMKTTVYGPVIYVEQEDAASFEDQEEITLMDWGNAIVRSKETSPSGEVTSITMDLHLEGDFKKTKKKITWLAEHTSSNPLANVTLLDYDYLITKKKLEEDDELVNFVTPHTEFRAEAYADSNVLSLTKGDIIQFERKGYFILDAIESAEGGEKRLEFIRIPDGKLAGLASKAAVPGDAAADATKPPAEKKAKTPGKGGWGKGGAPTGLKKDPASTQDERAPLPEGTRVMLSEGNSGFEIPVSTTLHHVPRVFGDGDVVPPTKTEMYKVQSVYEA